MINFADEPTVKDYLRSCRRNWWIIAATLVVALAVGFKQAFLTKPAFKASAVVLADTSTSNTKDFVDRITVPEVNRVVELLSAHVLSNESLSKVAIEKNVYPGFEGTPEEMGASMRKNISTEVVGFDTFRVDFVHGDPQTAAVVANELAKLFINEHARQREENGDATNKLLSTELATMAADLKAKDAQMKKYRISALGALPGQTDGNMRAVERWQGDLRLNTQALQRARERLELSTASTPKLYQGEAIEALKAEIAGLQAERGELQRLIAKTEVLVNKSGEVEGTLQEMQREYNASLVTYNDLLRRRQDASIKVGLDRARYASLFKVIEPAKVPGSPFRPMRPIIMAIALLAGLLAGAALAVTRDYFDETFHEAAELARHTGLPVFAAVPQQGRLIPARAAALKP